MSCRTQAVLVVFTLASIGTEAQAKRLAIAAEGVPAAEVIDALRAAKGLSPEDVIDISEVTALLTGVRFTLRSPRPTGWPTALDGDWTAGAAECAAFGSDDDYTGAGTDTMLCTRQLASALYQRYLDSLAVDEVILVRVSVDPLSKSRVAQATRFEPGAARARSGSKRTGEDSVAQVLAAIEAAGSAREARVERENGRDLPKGPPADTPELRYGFAKTNLPPVDVGPACGEARVALDISPADAPLSVTTRMLYAKSLSIADGADAPALRCEVRLWQPKKLTPMKSRMDVFRGTLTCDGTPRVGTNSMGISAEHALQTMAPVLVKKLVVARCAAKPAPATP